MEETTPPRDPVQPETPIQASIVEVVKPSRLKIICVAIIGVVVTPVIQAACAALLLLVYCREGCGLEGFAIISFGAIVGIAVTIPIFIFISKKILKDGRSVATSLVIAVLIWVAILGVSSTVVTMQGKSLISDFSSVLDPVIDKSSQTHLEVREFEETGILGSDGFLETLSVKITVTSDQDVEINDPFRYIIADPNYPACHWVDASEERYLNTVNLRKGANVLTNSLNVKDLKNYGSLPSRDVEGPVILRLQFYGHVPGSKFRTVKENNSGNATEIENVIISPMIQRGGICNLSASDTSVFSKPYKIHVSYEPYPTPDYSD